MFAASAPPSSKDEMPLPLSPQVFAIISSLIEQHSGIHYAPRDIEMLADKLSRRATEREFDSLLDYYYYLRYDPAGPEELTSLIEALVVHETYFFRESDALRALVDCVLREPLSQGRRMRVWSAACATGEEPLTLAMILDGEGLLDRVDLVASDISRRALERAREGTFGGRSLRAIPAAMRSRYTTEQPGGRVTVRADLLRRITWRHVNLVDRAAVAELGVFDAIICRNALIYFSDESVRRTVDVLSDALRPGGVVLVGASESLLRFGIFECEERGGAFFYRKARP
jgi:chemotaxis protein methyltransferase CheR